MILMMMLLLVKQVMVQDEKVFHFFPSQGSTATYTKGKYKEGRNFGVNKAK